METMLQQKKRREVLTESEAVDLLKNHFTTFIEIYNKSKAETDRSIESDIANGIAYFNPSYKAMKMWHYAVNFSKEKFNDHDEIKPTNINGMYGLLFCDLLFIKLKKMNSKDLLTNNNPTEQSTAMNSQEEVPGFSGRILIYIGYVMNKTGTDFKSINITCPKSDRKLHWKYDILNNLGSESSMPMIHIDHGVNQDVTPTVRELLKIKESKLKNKNGDTGTN